MKNIEEISFSPACPKCESTTGFGVTGLGSAAYAERGGEWHDRVFACMCGKRLYGIAIKEEFDRQYEAWTEDREKRQAEARRERRRKLAEAKKQRDLEEARLEEQRKTLLRLGFCAWKDCTHRARENSIYCSRSCNNKNARAKHKARQKRS